MRTYLGASSASTRTTCTYDVVITLRDGSKGIQTLTRGIHRWIEDPNRTAVSPSDATPICCERCGVRG
ncbi:hypothetical protein D3C74_247950 [compost metagenome]